MPRVRRRLTTSLLTLLAAAVLPATASATTYYVSPSGRDSASGRSPAHAWRTVFRVDKAALRPGDRVLFQAGATFSDDSLQPGWGTAVSGARHRPVVFGSYGNGRATLSQGIWLKNERYLVFQDFNLVDGHQGVEGTGSNDVVQECTFTNFMSGTEVPINIIGSHWQIRGNYIDHTGDSGMLLRGDHFSVIGNRITNTGLDTRLNYGEHGIYLKAYDSKVIDNTILHFRDDGVSVRYSNSVVKGNVISGGTFGIAWFQYGTNRGTSRWLNNTISFTHVAGIYVSPQDIGGPTNENFIIKGNRIYRPGGRVARAAGGGGWTGIALSHNRGRYRIRGNHVA